MLSIVDIQRYFLYRGTTDMRKGIDSLAGLVRGELQMDPLSGDVFIFFNRKANQVKLLHWEKDGFGMYYKRLERGRFELPTTGGHQLSSQTLGFILSGVELSSVKKRSRFTLKA
jgi:transposase